MGTDQKNCQQGSGKTEKKSKVLTEERETDLKGPNVRGENQNQKKNTGEEKKGDFFNQRGGRKGDREQTGASGGVCWNGGRSQSVQKKTVMKTSRTT